MLVRRGFAPVLWEMERCWPGERERVERRRSKND
jgi:hypothetical protein